MEKTLSQLTDSLTQRDKQLQDSEKLFRTAFCINPLPMSLTKMDGTIVKINRAMCIAIGLREEDLIGKKPSDYGLYTNEDERDLIVEKLTAGEKILNMPVSFTVRTGEIIKALLYAKVVWVGEEAYILAVCQYA